MNERSLRVLEWPKIKAQVAERASFFPWERTSRKPNSRPWTQTVRERLAMTSEALARSGNTENHPWVVRVISVR